MSMYFCILYVLDMWCSTVQGMMKADVSIYRNAPAAHCAVQCGAIQADGRSPIIQKLEV